MINFSTIKFKERMHNVKLKIAENEQLINLCRDRKYPADYPVATLITLKDFVMWGEKDVTKGWYERAAYNLLKLEELNEKLANELRDILEGKKKAFSTRVMQSSKGKIEGFSYLADYIDTATGEKKNGAIFQVGYGHAKQVCDDIPKFEQYGASLIQIELGPDSTVFPIEYMNSDSFIVKSDLNDGECYLKQYGDYAVNIAQIKKSLAEPLIEAEKHNIQICVLLSPHYMPSWAYEKWEDIRIQNWGFISFRVNDRRTQGIIQAHIEAVLDVIRDYPALHSICLSNEPAYISCLDETNLPHWQKYLQDKYNSIDNLNYVWNTGYKDFSEICMPQEVEGSPCFYEWYCFNNDLFSQWHRFMAELAQKKAPNVPLHVKTMNIFGSRDLPFHRNYLRIGTDPEALAEFSQLNGNDVCNFKNREHLPLSLKLSWYDYLASIKKMPVYDSEDHFIEDWDNDYSSSQVPHCVADIWQGAIHGRTMSTIWIWERAYHTGSDNMGSILSRPDVTEAVSRTALDLNRLAYEVTLLQNLTSQVGILYSEVARIYDLTYSHCVNAVYEGILFSGNKAGFVTDRQCANGGLSKYKIILLPHCDHLPVSTITALDEYVKTGGAIVVIGENAICFDEYNKSVDATLRNRILKDAVTLPTTDDGKERMLTPTPYDVQQVLLQKTKHQILIYDGGECPQNVEWFYTETEKGYLLSLLNHKWDTQKTITITLGGDEVKGKELITDTQIQQIDLLPFEPKLILISK